MTAANAIPSPQYDLAAKLARVQDEIRRERCAAFVDYAPTVCGLRLQPITLASYNRLIAFESPFVCGGPVGFEDVFAFCWLHSPHFGQWAEIERKRTLRACYWAVTPRWPNLINFVRVASQFPGFRWMARFRRTTGAERLAGAVAEIRRLVAEALNDFPRGDDAAPPSPVALHAQLLNAFRRQFGVGYAEAESMPLKKAVQLLRESLHTSGGKGLSMMHPREAQIWTEHLDRHQARAAAANTTTKPTSAYG